MYSAARKSVCKPPLPISPRRLRSRPSFLSSSLQTPTGSLAKFQKINLSPNMRPEYHTISCELRALAKMVRDEFGNANSENVGGGGASGARNSCGGNPNVMFERGRLYDEYSAKRNERLKRKKGVAVVEESKAKPAHAALGVTVESGKKGSSRKYATLRKSVSAAYSAEVSETPRYMLRSRTKENAKPPLAIKSDKSVMAGKKVGGRSVGGRI